MDIAYSTGFVDRPPDDVRTIRIEDRGRGVGVFPIENDRWQVGFAGRGDDHPPMDPEAMERFAGSLTVSAVNEILDECDWRDTPIAHYRFPSNQRYRYEDLDRFPDGLVVIGDAIASFNPTFGQGMTVSVFEALVLHHIVSETGLDDLGRQFFHQIGEVVDTPWFQAVVVDSAFSENSGPMPAGVESYREYMGRLGRTAHDDGVVAEAWSRVIQLEQSLSSVLQPSIVRRVFDDTDEDAPVAVESPAFGSPSLGDVGLLLEENLTNSEGVAEWPGVSIDPQPEDRENS